MEEESGHGDDGRGRGESVVGSGDSLSAGGVRYRGRVGARESGRESGEPLRVARVSTLMVYLQYACMHDACVYIGNALDVSMI